MKHVLKNVSVFLVFAQMYAMSVAHAQRAHVAVDAEGDAAQVAASLSPKARGELARRFVHKWGAYVQEVYGTPVSAWAQRMVPTFATADPANFRLALRRETLERALAELDGSAGRLNDGRVIERFAGQTIAASRTTRGDGSDLDLKTLGSTNSDLTFTPVQPCRIVDTRIAGGPVATGGARSFRAVSAGDYTEQGGSASDCGLGAIAASAVALNVTAVTPAVAGFATVYPFGSARPGVASVNYAAGDVVNNAIIAQIPNPLQSLDFTLYSFAQAHYVIDIVGYFAPPQATALQCVNTRRTQLVEAGGIFNMSLPACPEGFAITGAGCGTAGFNQANLSYTGVAGEGAQCIGTNITAGQIGVLGTARCCRVPGR
jgi:hypothetical protein